MNTVRLHCFSRQLDSLTRAWEYRRSGGVVISLIVIVFAFLFGFDGSTTNLVMFLRQEYVPTREHIMASDATFILDTTDVVGWYGFVDIPSEIISYSLLDSNGRTTNEVIHTLEDRAIRQGWHVGSRNDTELRFTKHLPNRTNTTNFYDVRVSVVNDHDGTATVIVCKTVADARGPDARFIEQTDEFSYISKRLWPRYEAIVRQLQQ